MDCVESIRLISLHQFVRQERMESTLRQLRHDLRGRANALMLCASALPYAADDMERLEFVDEVLLAADKLVAVLDKLESLPEHTSAAVQD